MLYKFFVYISQVVFLFLSLHLSITKPHSYLCLLIFLHLFVNFIFQDYSVTYGHCPEITVYTSCCYFPSAAQLPSLWAENKKSLLSMLVEVSNPLLEANCQEYVQWKLLSKHFLHLLPKFLCYWFYFLIILFIFIYLFLAVLGLHWCAGFSLVGANRGSFSLQCSGFSLRGLLLLRSRALGHVGSVVAAPRL